MFYPLCLACEKRIQVNESRYFASSVQSVDESNAAIFVDSGVWLTADSLKREKNQFLHLDLGRLMRVSKVCDVKYSSQVVKKAITIFTSERIP